MTLTLNTQPDAKRSKLTAIKRAGMQQMSDGVVCHVDGGVRQRLDQILLVPRNSASYVISLLHHMAAGMSDNGD